MFLIVLGVLVLLAGIVVSRQHDQSARFGNLIRIAGLVVIIAGALTSMFKVIDAGTVGVKSIFGKVDNDVLYSGLNVVNPVAEITTFDVKTQNYTMSGATDESGQSADR